MRSLLSMLAFAAVVGIAASAQAQYGFWERSALDFRRNTCWPEPFKSAEKAAYPTAFTLMAVKGWRLEHTLGDYHFDPVSQELNSAGVSRLRSLLTEAVPQRRAVFVLRASDEDATLSRVDSVQQAASQIAYRGPLPQVFLTDDPPRGWPGDSVDAVYRGMRANTPKPVLPAATGGSSGE